MHAIASPRLIVGTPLLLVFLLAGCGGGNASEHRSPEEQQVALGQRVYQQQCVTCHQAGGRGVGGVYPPLHETKWTTGDKGRLIRLVLHGMEGPMKVKGQRYNQRMRSLSYLTDEQIAAVLTYVRQRFGNDASAVAPEEVTAVRAATAGREEVWTPSALWQETGIPAMKKQPSADGQDASGRDSSARAASE